MAVEHLTPVTSAVGGAVTQSIELSSSHSTGRLIDLFWQADFTVQLVMIALLFCSLWSWAVAFDKWILFYSTKRKMKKFEQLLWSDATMETLFRQSTANNERHPLAVVLVAAVDEWNAKGDKDGRVHNPESFAARIKRSMDIALSKSAEVLDAGLYQLAMIASVSPFIGLFGTVWGIMDSFQAISVTKNTTLAVVAPGIAEALFATALGLVAAIPAVILYNKMITEVDAILNRAEHFSNELLNIIVREIE